MTAPLPRECRSGVYVSLVRNKYLQKLFSCINTLALPIQIAEARGGMPQDSLLELVGLIYDAALDAQRWPAFLKKYADVIGADGVLFQVHNLDTDQGNVALSFNLDESVSRAYDQHYAGLNEWVRRGSHLLETGNIVTGQMAITDADLLKTEFYNEFLRQAKIFHNFGGIIRRDGNRISGLTALRPRSRPAFSETESSVLRVLMPHLQRAVQLHRRFFAIESIAGGLSQVLDRLPVACILISSHGRVMAPNRMASEIVNQNDGFRIDATGEISGLSVSETSILQRLLRTAARTGNGKALDAGGVCVLSRRSLRRPFQILVTPLHSGDWLQETLRAAAALIISDPETGTQGNGNVLRQVFGFTPTESKLGILLMNGQSLEDAADALHITIATARTHLKRLLSKTGTSRQTELVRLLLTSLASVK